MSPGRWRRICGLFESAQELPAAERAAWVAAQCNGDEELAMAVGRMLEAGAEEFLETPALSFSHLRLGPWRTIREIGRGGMGIVYLGERADGLFQQQVAIKIAPGGVHTETGLLARLQHPSIARLLDAGATPEGFPFLVMEYVDGVPLDEWVVRDVPSQQQRLAAFQEICAAVQHAHQNLILHRDLKPSNVMIAGGRPKLLDFGIAKPLDLAGEATQSPAATPEYASPEQLLGEPLGTASDVYSLGLLLHMLLAGKPPRDYHCISLRDVVEQAARREPLPIAVPGDLGRIIGKATEPDPSHRYGAAGELGEEIRRFREGLPVRARPPSLAYRADRFLRRHKGKLAIAAAVFVMLAGAAWVAVQQARTADRRFRQVRGLAASVLYEIHDRVAELPGSNPARLVLSERALEYLEALSKEAGSDADVWSDVAAGYLRLGDVQGGSALRNLGQYEQAAESYAKAEDIAARLAQASPANVEARKLRLRAEKAVLNSALRGAGRLEALPRARAHVQQAERFQHESGDPEAPRLVAEAHMLLATALLYNARHDETLAQWQRTLKLFETLPAEDYTHLRKVAALHQFLCDEYLRIRDTANARAHIERAVALQEDARRHYPQLITARMDLALCRYQYAVLLAGENRHAEAVAALDQLIPMREQLVREEPTDVLGKAWLAAALGRRGQSLRELGRIREASAALEAALKQYVEVSAAEKGSQRFQASLAETEAELAAVQHLLGRRTEACEHYRGAARLFDGLLKEAKAASRNPAAAEAVRRALAQCEAAN